MKASRMAYCPPANHRRTAIEMAAAAAAASALCNHGLIKYMLVGGVNAVGAELVIKAMVEARPSHARNGA